MFLLEKRQQELAGCDFVKAVLMLLIVLYHSMLFWGGSWFTGNPVSTSNLIKVISLWLNSFHIYAFTLVSGYIFYYSKYEKGKYKNFLKFLINKSKRLLIPYWFVTIFWAIPFQCIFICDDISMIIKNYLLGEAPAQLWYLLMLFFVFIIFWPLSNFLKNYWGGGFLVIAIYGMGVIGAKLIPNIYMVWTSFEYILFFYLGFKIRQSGSDIFKRFPDWCWLVIDLALFYCYLMIPVGNIFGKFVQMCIEMSLNIFGALGSFILLQRLNLNISNNSYARQLAQKNMGIYLFHQQLIYITIWFLNGKN